jgi:RNA polymerase sigma-70 factor (ECF subfamily)
MAAAVTSARERRDDPPSDEALVHLALAGDSTAFEALMRRYNQRLYRVARAILREDDETEDVLQQAYLNAFSHLRQYENRGSFAAWLTRIAVHEAFARRRKRAAASAAGGGGSDGFDRLASPRPDPEQAALAGELRRTLEERISSLSDLYRPVFVLRKVEGLSTAETAEALGLSEDVVKTRLRRACATLRDVLSRDGRGLADLFRFGFERCDRIVAAVHARFA